MSTQPTFLIEGVVAYLVAGLLLVSVILWAFRLRPLLRRCGGKPSCWLFGWAMLVDYARLVRLLRAKKMNDPLVRVLEVCYGGAAIQVLLMLVKLTVETLSVKGIM